MKSALERLLRKKENQLHRKRKAAAKATKRRDAERKNIKVYVTCNFDLAAVF
jgi:hypothetical protein